MGEDEREDEMTVICETCGTELRCEKCGGDKSMLTLPYHKKIYECLVCWPEVVHTARKAWEEYEKDMKTYEARVNGGFA